MTVGGFLNEKGEGVTYRSGCCSEKERNRDDEDGQRRRSSEWVSNRALGPDLICKCNKKPRSR